MALGISQQLLYGDKMYSTGIERFIDVLRVFGLLFQNESIKMA
jgi:hypothetical protein